MIRKLFTAFIIILTAESFSQSFPGGFNFNLPANDTTWSGFLPFFPADPIKDDEFIEINPEGHFAVKGNPIRFWGSNIVSGAAFPDTNKVWFIAGRLRKMGFNLIRFHHIDNPWGYESLFDPNNGTRQLNPVTLNKMEYLIAELKKNGIYINMNLNVSRTFKASDGVPDADSLIDFAKGVTQFDPHLISLQMEYAEQLLTHINPHTGMALVDDPVMAMVEMANENSLYRMWRDDKLKPFALGGSLTIRHTQMLDSLWNTFIKNKYQNTSNLAQSWNQGIYSGEGTNQIVNGDFESGDITTNWRLELHENALADTSRAGDYHAGQGFFSAQVTVTNATGTAWHIQWKHVGLSSKKDSVYTVEFSARADGNKTIAVSVMRDNSPYTYYDGQNFSLSDEWTSYSFSIKAPETTNGQVRLTFQFPEEGIFLFDMIKLKNAEKNGLLSNESIENQNIKRTDFSECLNFSNNRVKDISEFYITLQKNYFETMRGYLVNVLGVKVPVVGTNWNTGTADLSIQSTMDYIDNHAYWDHPSFPNIPWSSTDWIINNIPMVNSTSGGTIPGLFAGAAMAGKPYTISEYNHAFPNRYQVEAPLFIAAYSSFHYADGIMFFDYNGANDWETDKVNSYFSIHRNNALISLMPSCAYAYRNSLISKAKETLLINYSDEKIKLMPAEDPGGWQPYYSFPQKLALKHAIRNQSFESSSTTDFESFPPEPGNPYISDTDEIIYNTDGLLKVITPQFIGMTGYLDAFPAAEVTDLQVKSSSDFGTVTWLSLTGDSLKSAEKSLLTLSSKIQNTGMIWEGTTTIHNNWGNAPTQMHPLQVTLELFINADSIHIFPLNSKGAENPQNYTTCFPEFLNMFTVTLDQDKDKTLWYGIKKFGNGNITSVEKRNNIPSEYKLEQNYPNPFNPVTTIFYSVPSGTRHSVFLQIKVYDVLGNEAAVLVSEEKTPGNYQVKFDASNLSSGVYFYKLTAGNFSDTKKLILLK